MTAVAQSEIENALKDYVDPYLEQDLVSAKVVKDLNVDGAKVQIHVVLGFPAKGYVEELRQTLESTIGALDGVEQTDISVEWKLAAHKSAKRGRATQERQEHHRHRLGQGRGREVDGGVQSGACVVGRGRHRRGPRCRHLRPESAADAGGQRPTGVHRWKVIGAQDESRIAVHVHRLPRRRGDTDDLARADGHPSLGAAAQGH